MANEAILRDANVKTSRRFNCADANFTKGEYLVVLSTGYVSNAYIAGSNVSGVNFAGFAHSDKEAGDGQEICADKGGVYNLLASGAIVHGAYVKVAGKNCVGACTVADMTCSMAMAIGVSMVDIADTATGNVEVFD